MDRRTFLTSALGATGALALGSCQQRGGPRAVDTAPAGTPPPAPRPTLRLAGDDNGFPSPFAYQRGGGYVQMSYIYDTLLWKDASGELIPWLARDFQGSPDGLTYTFRLRDGITWHDGRPLTAEDVAFSFTYFAAQQLSPTVIVQPVPDIAEVRATDERTVQFRLRNPVATFLQFGGAGAVPIVPRHIWSSIQDAAKASDPQLLVGSGPYRLESYTPGEGAYLYSAYDDYFLGTPFVARIENRPVGDELTALRAGELDQAGSSGVRPDALAPFRDDPSFEILEAPTGVSTLSLYWNLSRGGALADVRFRRACALAIDRNDMVTRLFGGNGVRGNPGWIPPGNPFHVEVEQYAFDPAAANRLLDEAGFTRPGPAGARRGPNGQPLRFELLVAGRPPPAVELVVRALGAVGVELMPQALDTPTFNQRVIAGNTEMSLIGSGGMNSDLAPDYLRLVYSSQTKLTQHAQGYRNPEVDRLTQEQLQTLDESKRKEIVARIQHLVASDLPLLPLFYPDSFTVYRKEAFDQWYYTPGGVAGVIPTVNNRQVLVTGRQAGLEIRPFTRGG
ncbi:MAG: ABC transporter substrate-binding protein [Actinomycetota bacterium]|nr:ABC transporter substrate-binding protein [Actinomycetota bacterium]